MKTAVLLMSYGSPEKMDEVLPYLRGIYHGKPVPQYAIDENTRKYAMVNGISPSTAIMNSLLAKMNKALVDYDGKAYLANKHWKPWLEDVLPAIAREKPNRIVGIPVFPFRSENVRSSYYRPLMEIAGRTFEGMHIEFVNGFSENTIFVDMWKDILAGEIERYSPDYLVFSAHSLPTETGSESEYQESFMKAADRISRSLNFSEYMAGFQSRGRYGKSWLGPSLYELSQSLEKGSSVLVVPIGFCYEHMEVIYDLDHEFGSHLAGRGIKYSRSHLPDDSDQFVKLLLDTVGPEMQKDIERDYA
jgi:ferrochelatase